MHLYCAAGQASARDSPCVESPPCPLSSQSVHAPSSSPITSSPLDIQNSAVHKMAACGDFDALRMLILDHDADVNLPMKDGTTPVHCAVEKDCEGEVQLYTPFMQYLLWSLSKCIRNVPPTPHPPPPFLWCINIFFCPYFLGVVWMMSSEPLKLLRHVNSLDCCLHDSKPKTKVTLRLWILGECFCSQYPLNCLFFCNQS